MFRPPIDPKLPVDRNGTIWAPVPRMIHPNRTLVTKKSFFRAHVPSECTQLPLVGLTNEASYQQPLFRVSALPRFESPLLTFATYFAI
jgi:hypothetical protein